MGIRRKSGIQWVVVLALFLALAVAGGFYIQYSSGDNSYRTLEKLDNEAYLENANALRGNIYKVEGVVQNSLAWSPSKGRLFSITTRDGAEESFLPVLIPPEFSSFNIQKGQKLTFKVEIIEGGFVKVIDMKKP